MKQNLLFLFFFLSKACLGQPSVNQFVIENTEPVTTLDPNEDGFSDLKSMDKAIGNKRIVMLGERYHGDATATSEDKARSLLA